MPGPTTITAPTQLEMVRRRETFRHLSSRDREITVEYTISNPTTQTFDLLYLPLPEFARGLVVEDENGRYLNFLPNSAVKAGKKKLEESSPEDYAFFVQRFKHVQYPLAVLLPEDAKLSPDTLRTIRLRYQAHAPVRMFRPLTKNPRTRKRRGLFFRVAHWWIRTIFSIPFMETVTTRFPGHDYDHFVVVQGTPEYSTFANYEVDGIVEDQIYTDGFDDDTRVISTRLPAATQGPYRWKMAYEQMPAASARLGFLASLLPILGAISALRWLGFLNGWAAWISDPIFGVGLTTLMLGLILELEKPWEDRYKILLAVPLTSEAILLAFSILNGTG